MKQNMNVNGFDKAVGEHANRKKEAKVSYSPKKVRERKQQMSIVLTPTDKEDVRKMADNEGLSVSELFANWIEEKR